MRRYDFLLKARHPSWPRVSSEFFISLLVFCREATAVSVERFLFLVHAVPFSQGLSVQAILPQPADVSRQSC